MVAWDETITPTDMMNVVMVQITTKGTINVEDTMKHVDQKSVLRLEDCL
jgi:hypothetical protein